MNYHNLDVYNEAKKLTCMIYALCRFLPKEELHAISNQMRRAVVSIASNIAEGSARTTKDYIHFLKISAGSTNEVLCQLEICGETNMLNSSDTIYSETYTQGEKVARMLHALINSLSEKT